MNRHTVYLRRFPPTYFRAITSLSLYSGLTQNLIITFIHVVNRWSLIFGYSGCKSQFVLPQKSSLQNSSFSPTFKFKKALQLNLSMWKTSICCFILTHLRNHSFKSHRPNSQSENMIFHFHYRFHRPQLKRYSNLLSVTKLFTSLSLASANYPTQKWIGLNTTQTCPCSIHSTSQA
jgi:hypothetical protein